MVEEKERKSISNVGMLDSGKSYKRQLPEVVHNMLICYPNYKNPSKKYVLPASIINLVSFHPVETLSLLLSFTPLVLRKKERKYVYLVI